MIICSESSKAFPARQAEGVASSQAHLLLFLFSQLPCFCQIKLQAKSKLQCFLILTVILCLLPCRQFSPSWLAACPEAQGHCFPGRLCQIKPLAFLEVKAIFSPLLVRRDLISIETQPAWQHKEIPVLPHIRLLHLSIFLVWLLKE